MELGYGAVDDMQTLADLRRLTPELGLKVPSVLDTLTLWQTLRAAGDELVGAKVIDKTHICYFNMAPKRLDGQLCVPDSYIADEGMPRLSSVSIGNGGRGARLAVG